MTTDLPPRCNRCHRRVPTGRLVAGYGVRCARRYGLTPQRRVRAKAPVRTGGGGEVPVLDGLEELMQIEESEEQWVRPEPTTTS